MNLVKLEKYENVEIPITTSKLIAEITNNKHHSITKLVQTYEKDFSEFGVVRFEIEKTSISKNGTKQGRPEKIYFLNEQQATLLMTYLKNTDAVRAFKIELVKQFYEMKKFILESNLVDEFRCLPSYIKLKKTVDVLRIKRGSKTVLREYINTINFPSKKCIHDDKYFYLKISAWNSWCIRNGYKDPSLIMEQAVEDGLDVIKGFYITEIGIENFGPCVHAISKKIFQ